jgi:hypothetical protein
MTPSGVLTARPASPARPVRRLALSPRVRRAVLVVHIVASVALLGDAASYGLIAVRASAADDPAFAAAAYDLLADAGLVFGIPLSFAALISGVVLGLGTKWGVLRHAWTTIKLGLLVSVILVGALVLGPGAEAAGEGDAGARVRLIAGSAWDVLALGVATGVSVFKPRRRR